MAHFGAIAAPSIEMGTFRQLRNVAWMDRPTEQTRDWPQF